MFLKKQLIKKEKNVSNYLKISTVIFEGFSGIFHSKKNQKQRSKTSFSTY